MRPVQLDPSKVVMRVAATASAFGGAKCVVVTNTYYTRAPDDQFRALLMAKTLERYAELNADVPGAFPVAALNAAFPSAFPVVVVDTSPDPSFVRDMCRQYGATYLDGREAPGIGPQTLMGVRYAYCHGAEHVLRIDPEKYGLAARNVMYPLVEELVTGGADILSIGRLRDTAFASLPPYQQITERNISRALATLGLPEDTASGIRAMNRRGMSILMQFDPEQHGKQWEFMWYFLIDAMKAGLNVKGLFLPFIHPVEMLLKETGQLEDTPEAGGETAYFYDNKRDMQLALIVPKVVAYAASCGIYPVWDPKREWII